MAKILWQKDLTQDAQISDLYSKKVDLTAFNAAINDINNNLADLKDQHTKDINNLKTYIDDSVQSLKDNEIKALQDAVNLLNADANTQGSVDYKIKQAIDALVNGAGEAYDTLKEIVDYINSEASDFKTFIDNLNQKITDLIDNASDDYNTLGKIEQRIKEVNDRIDQLQGDTDESIATVLAKLPIYKIDDKLTISSDNKITLTYKPTGDIINRTCKVYFTDNNGNRIIIGEYTVSHDSDDKTGKVYVIETDETFGDDKNAIVQYFYNKYDNPDNNTSNS